MSNLCLVCGRTESDAIADAKTLGLQQEFQAGVYTCCQIAEWADEQASAWLDAIHADGDRCEPEPVLVPVRSRRAQVPWYRNPNDRR
jgi:hypothetical protein